MDTSSNKLGLLHTKWHRHGWEGETSKEKLKWHKIMLYGTILSKWKLNRKCRLCGDWDETVNPLWHSFSMTE